MKILLDKVPENPCEKCSLTSTCRKACELKERYAGQQSLLKLAKEVDLNDAELIKKINRYLTRRFIADPDGLPSDECEREAKEILGMIRES